MPLLRKSTSEISAVVLTWIVFIVAALPTTYQSIAQGGVPNGTFHVTYQKVEDGKISPSYHELTLSCYSGSCELLTITFNKCWDRGNMGSFSFIKPERSSSVAGSLKIISTSKDTLVLEEPLAGGGLLTYRFTFKSDKLGLLDITDFTGAGLRYSAILEKTVSWQLVPLRTTDKTHFKTVKTDCPIRVSALPAK